MFTCLRTPRRNLLFFFFIRGKTSSTVALVDCFDRCIKVTVWCLYMFNSFHDFRLASALISTVGREASCTGMNDVREYDKKNHSFVCTAQHSLSTLPSTKISRHLCLLANTRACLISSVALSCHLPHTSPSQLPPEYWVKKLQAKNWKKMRILRNLSNLYK